MEDKVKKEILKNLILKKEYEDYIKNRQAKSKQELETELEAINAAEQDTDIIGTI